MEQILLPESTTALLTITASVLYACCVFGVYLINVLRKAPPQRECAPCRVVRLHIQSLDVVIFHNWVEKCLKLGNLLIIFSATPSHSYR